VWLPVAAPAIPRDPHGPSSLPADRAAPRAIPPTARSTVPPKTHRGNAVDLGPTRQRAEAPRRRIDPILLRVASCRRSHGPTSRAYSVLAAYRPDNSRCVTSDRSVHRCPENSPRERRDLDPTRQRAEAPTSDRPDPAARGFSFECGRLMRAFNPQPGQLFRPAGEAGPVRVIGSASPSPKRPVWGRSVCGSHRPDPRGRRFGETALSRTPGCLRAGSLSPPHSGRIRETGAQRRRL
jgi:hypothetical protein